MNPYAQHNQELIQAAKRAAKSGSRQDLQAYMKLRKETDERMQAQIPAEIR